MKKKVFEPYPGYRHYVNSVQIRSYVWSVFSLFGLNTEIYGHFSPSAFQ